MNSAILIFFLSLVVFSENLKLPSNFQKCNRKQPDLKQCVLKAAQDGVSQLTRAYPEINIQNINPFEISEFSVSSGGTVSVEQKYKNCKLYGSNKIKFDKFEFNFEEKTLEVLGTFPEILMKCQYEVNGQVLLLPVRGKGESEINLKNLRVAALINYQETKRKNKTFIKVYSIKINLEPEHVSTNFENLFNGDKRMSDNINQVINDNWKEVFDDVKDGYIKVIADVVTSLLNSFFSKVSLEEAFG